MIELSRALSEMPTYSTPVISSTTSSAGRSMIAPGAVPGRVGQRDRQMKPQPLDDHAEVTGPSDRHRRRADRVFEHQVPSDDPAHQLAHRGVGVRIGASGHRDHRGELRIAQRRHRARGPGQHERRDQSWSRLARADAGHHENSGADDRADSEQRQVEGAQRALEAAGMGRRVRHQRRRGFAPEKLAAQRATHHDWYPPSTESTLPVT